MTTGSGPEGPGAWKGPTSVDPAPAEPGVTGAQGGAAGGVSYPAAPGPAASQPDAVSPGTAPASAPAANLTGEESPHTGLDPVDRVLARGADVARLPVTERAAAYEELHVELERILSEDPERLPTGLPAASSPAVGRSGAPRPGDGSGPGEAPRPGNARGSGNGPHPSSNALGTGDGTAR